MSETPPPTNGLAGLTEDEALAMDHALGALGRADRKAAELRVVGDPDFRARVERWQTALAPLDEATAPASPPPAVWAAIAAETVAQAPRAVPAPAPAAPRGWWHNLALWRGLGLGAPVAAAIAVAVMVQPDAVPVVAPASGPALRATLAGSDGKPLLAAAFDPASGQVRFAPVAQNEAGAGKVPELWVIEGSNPPRSLGVIDISAGSAHRIPRDRLAGLKEGSILAISIEPVGGSPTGTPTGPVIATGALSAA
ncbi:MAG: anti-sigma factor [Alphaproteobacteria bacterium]|nr:anti-sigma factor [Alphaproteobacteria bacterium]